MTRLERLTIGGMSCATCSETVSESLEALDGVEEASVNFATDEGTVEYDHDTVSLAEIYEAIDEVGYDRALAGAAMSASSVSVMSNSLAFARYTPDRDYVPLPLRPFRRLLG